MTKKPNDFFIILNLLENNFDLHYSITMGKSHKKHVIILQINHVEFPATIEGLHITLLFTDLKMITDLMGAKLKLKPQEQHEISI